MCPWPPGSCAWPSAGWQSKPPAQPAGLLPLRGTAPPRAHTVSRPGPLFLAPPFPVAPAGWPGVLGGAGGSRPMVAGCGTNQFSPNFFLGQSGAGSDEEFHSRRSGARLNAEQTGPPAPQPKPQPEPSCWLLPAAPGRGQPGIPRGPRVPLPARLHLGLPPAPRPPTRAKGGQSWTPGGALAIP